MGVRLTAEVGARAPACRPSGKVLIYGLYPKDSRRCCWPPANAGVKEVDVRVRAAGVSDDGRRPRTARPAAWAGLVRRRIISRTELSDIIRMMAAALMA